MTRGEMTGWKHLRGETTMGGNGLGANTLQHHYKIWLAPQDSQYKCIIYLYHLT